MGIISRFIKVILPRRIKIAIKQSISGSTYQEVRYDLNVSHEGRLKDQVVLVTGGTGAIGSAICYRLVAEGANVGVCGRSIDNINKVLQNIELMKGTNSGTAIPIILDVTDSNNIDIAFDELIKKYGRIDVLINNAGGGARKDSQYLYQQEVDIIDSVIKTNLSGTIHCSRKAAKQMVLQNSGTIINMSSVVGMSGKAKMSDYAAAKAGIIGFTKSLAIELGEYNINVNCVSPGMVNQVIFDRGLEKRNTTLNSLGYFGKTDDVASLVSFLVSKEARYITGQNFVIDGGRSLGLMGDFYNKP